MSTVDSLLGATARRVVYFLKATTKKQIWIPTHTRKGGVVVQGHYAMVHVSADHDDHKVLSGDGSHSQKIAHTQLSGEQWFKDLHDEHKLPILLQHATGIQDKASAASTASVFKKKILAGQKPTSSEWKAFDTMPDDKQQAFIDAFAAAGKEDAFGEQWFDYQAANPKAVVKPVEPQPMPPETKPVSAAPAPKVTAAAKTKPAAPAAPAKVVGGSNAAVDAHVAAIHAHMLDAANTNAKSVNPKLAAIAEATKKGDVKTLLMMGYNTNTYGKKLAKLANQALALHGSAHTVSPGQKMASHPGLKGGEPTPAATPAAIATVATPATPAPAAAPAAKPTKESPAVKKAKAIDPAKVTAWLSGPSGGKDTSVFDGVPKASVNKFLKWNSSAQKSFKTASGQWTLVYENAAISSLYGMHDQVLMKDGSFVKVSAMTFGEIKDVASSINIEAIKSAAIAALSGAAEKPARPPKAEPPDEMQGWSFDAKDEGFSGAPTLSFQGPTTSFHIAKTDEGGYEAIAWPLSVDEGELESETFATAAGAAAHIKSVYNVTVPPAALQTLDSGGKAVADTGPKEGDTKQGAEGMLVLKDGHWVKVGAAAPAAPAAPKTTIAKQIASKKYVNVEDGHSKFWSVGVTAHFGKFFLVTHYGKIGSKGSMTVKEFPSLAAANAASDKIIDSKKAKGYTFDAKTSIFADVPVSAATAAPTPAAPTPAPKVVGATQAAPAPAPAAPLESIDGWKKTGGQGGYNEGGTYVDSSGTAWYCKFPANGEHVVKNELLATKLYQLAGVDVPEVKLITQGGKVGLASKILTGAKHDKAALLAGKAPGLLSGFATDAWLANWDVIGNNPAAGKGFDNIMIGPDGKAYRIDAGGSMLYGGAGGKKHAFGDKVPDLQTMLDPEKNKHTSAVFGKMTPADIAASVSKVAAISDDAINALVNEFGPGTPAERAALAGKLISRKADMLKQYPAAAKAVPKARGTSTAPPKVAGVDTSWVKLKPGEKIVEAGEQFGGMFAKIEVPPSGFNEAGLPKPYTYDKSSSQFVNEQNTLDIKSVYDTAVKTHDPQAVQDLKYVGIDKATGAKTGKMLSLDQHPSKAYVKEYVNQVAAELKAQTSPTFKILHSGGFTSSYSAAAAQIASKAKTLAFSKFAAWKDKAADYLVLDRKEASGIPTPAAGSFHDVEPSNAAMKAFKSASDAGYAKLTAAEKSACQAYTGSAYWKWNAAMRLGSVESADFKGGESMRKAFAKAAVELPNGIILHRGLNVGGDTYKSVIGAVIQDGSFQSTSYGKKAAFSMQSQLRLHITKGVKAMQATSFSIFGTSEREIILHPNCRYVVTGVTQVGGQNVVDVLVLPHEE